MARHTYKSLDAAQVHVKGELDFAVDGEYHAKFKTNPHKRMCKT